MKLPIYRSEALDRLSSPDRLDRLIQIVSPQAWLSLAAFASVVLMIVLWGIFGEITSTVEQDGMLQLSNDIVMVSASESGHIDTLMVADGDRIEVGELVAIIELPENDADGNPIQEEIISPIRGEVVSVRVDAGSPVNEGTPLISLQDFSAMPDSLSAITFLTLDQIQDVSPDMPVLLQPIALNNRIEGYLRGQVTFVSPYPATEREIETLLGVNNYVKDENSLLFEVRITPEQDESGYVWTVASDADLQLISGMAVNIIIETSMERPINYLFKVGQ